MNVKVKGKEKGLTISRAPTFIPISDDSIYHHTDQLAHNRLGFRYMPAGLAPEGSIIPFRTIESAPQAYRVSWEDRSPFVKVTQDGLGLLGEKGFRSARCNAPVREGRWYMEVMIEHGGGARASDVPGPPTAEGAHVRLGWGRREAPLGGPCGLDGYSYGMRDKKGEKITLSRPRPYGQPFGSGDVVGLYISLPSLRQGSKRDTHDPAHIKRERIAIEFKGQEYFESLEYTQSKEMIGLMDFSRKPADTTPNVPERERGTSNPSEPTPMRALPTLPESKIAFFVNGQNQGVAFRICTTSGRFAHPLTHASRRRRSARVRAHASTRRINLTMAPSATSLSSPSSTVHASVSTRPDLCLPPSIDIDAMLAGKDAQPPTDANGDNTNAITTATMTWRPLCERYSEFMKEQWALDQLEEEQAHTEAAQRATTVQAEAEKKSDVNGNAHRPTPKSAPSGRNWPSTPGLQSAYGSEYGDGEGEEQEQEQEQEEDGPPDDLGDIYGDPAKLLQYRRAVAVRMEEEED
ncbi:hypothetical protein B0F90DRAFT_1809675 [Multifurca ochricompacta]|uniref:B30.2/SPRY domain-containing protein n=1 Tax=Multifurca ochricompacta TaxID=376703 RepID=A0AAD4M6D0_9AGAM|nr:hypothetical protein B0F90DRAFT_1809675 [Multifurca ochricompacta]